MSVNAYEDILLGSLANFLALSAKIGGDVATQADLVKQAFDVQFAFVRTAADSAAPATADLQNLLKPTSDQISAIQSYREKHRTSPFFNHLSAISESIPALGWVCVGPDADGTSGVHQAAPHDRTGVGWKEQSNRRRCWSSSTTTTMRSAATTAGHADGRSVHRGGRRGRSECAVCSNQPGRGYHQGT